MRSPSRPTSARRPRSDDRVRLVARDARQDRRANSTREIVKLQAEEAAIRARGTIAHVMNEKTGEPMAFILFRGDYDKRRDQVEADTPDVAAADARPICRATASGSPSGCLPKDHPLTARVTVNRFWQEIFGTGLVKTSGDFGIAGELPSAPGTARLAGRRVPRRRSARAWDVKQFFKLIVTSRDLPAGRDRDAGEAGEGPRQPAALARPALPHGRRDDPRLRPGRRAACSSARLGGPSVKPYQPEGVWEAVAMIGSNTRDYKRDNGENLYRRSMYTFWKRSAPPAVDGDASTRRTARPAPSAASAPTRRCRRCVTLNDVQFVEAARVLAEKAHEGGDTDDEPRIDFIAKRLLARPFTPQELAIVEGVARRAARELRGEAGRREEADRRRRVEGRPDARRGRTRRVDDARQPADESGRGAEQVTGASGRRQPAVRDPRKLDSRLTPAARQETSMNLFDNPLAT